MSLYGEWVMEGDLPAFLYSADQDAIAAAEWDPIAAPSTRRHWVLVGNRSISLRVTNDGRFALLDERYGQRWLTCPDPGTGISVVESAGRRWGTAWDLKPSEIPLRCFGPTWCRIAVMQDDIALERTLLCPEGEAPWVLVRVQLTNRGGEEVALTHREEWAVAPRFLNLFARPQHREEAAGRWVRFDVESVGRRLVARERRQGSAEDHARRVPEPDPQGGGETASRTYAQIFGPPVEFVLEELASGHDESGYLSDGGAHPVLAIQSAIRLRPGETRTLWFRAGAADEAMVDDPQALMDGSRRQLEVRLPRASAVHAAMAEREIPWHAALLTGGLCRDEIIGGHTLNQSSAYLDPMGFNGAARDPLQHALPLVYFEPDMALSVLRNTCAWSGPDGELPYALDGAKQPASIGFRPSDQSLWAFLLAAEYCAATGNVAAFAETLAYHPAHGAQAVSLEENLRRQFRYFVDGVGTGQHGHVRMLNADWNDMAVTLSGVPRREMATHGESVLNTAMAATVLPIYAGLCQRLGDDATAREARALGEKFRRAVAREWNGRWFNRAYAPGKGPLGVDDCWLEVQPWALLCGAAGAEQAALLLRNIDLVLRAGSPLGARVRGPVALMEHRSTGAGTGTDGGIWFSINMTLVWAASRIDQDLAWDEWRCMTLANHTHHYPHIWSGTLSGPDCYNGPEADRPGETWGSAGFAMQENPVNNQHSHSQPLLAYLRALGVEATADNRLQVRGGAAFESARLSIGADGHGWLETIGEVTVVTPFGEVTGTGRLQW